MPETESSTTALRGSLEPSFPTLGVCRVGINGCDLLRSFVKRLRSSIDACCVPAEEVKGGWVMEQHKGFKGLLLSPGRELQSCPTKEPCIEMPLWDVQLLCHGGAELCSASGLETSGDSCIHPLPTEVLDSALFATSCLLLSC